ncbi:MarR family winged helix-turn-helix transcriptional regulator [Pseudokineococcus basanitobsidens]|uniref:MarR family winged helix-turn-helix transcriptional regulator n=1 Tax=Pseudokineococcus basanitobsidens TaxID=1926649 RepID=A0ABU8RN40_9ACTN
MSSVPLALLLLRASRWFDARLLERLSLRGWPALSPAQSLVFAHLPEDGISPAELARRVGTSRQAAHQLLGGLVDLGLLQVVADPTRERGRLVVLTGTGRDLARDAAAVLADLEMIYGQQRSQVLRAVLEVEHTDGPARPR